MFNEARLKLTAWYLLIIFLVSTFFSLIIYLGAVRELARGYKAAEIRLMAREIGIHLPRQWSENLKELPVPLRNLVLREELAEALKAAKDRLKFRLLLINGIILAFSAVAGYGLAGATLQPIKQSMEEQKRFVADASHELRTPLTALRTSIEVALRDKKLSLKKARNLLKSNLEEVDSLKTLTSRLLSLATSYRNNNQLDFKKVNLKKIIKNAYKKVKPLAKDKKIKFDLKLEDLTAEVDETKLEEMMVIFLDNAVKYTPERGEVNIKAVKEGKKAVIEIRDTGIGIPKQEIPHIFDRFYRVDQSRSKDKVEGFGLGLALAKKIIEAHHGIVEVSSTQGKGTIFLIKFPLFTM